jgi:multidrug efflux pump subunit AcrA (membrane-fusion protein)
VGEVTRDAAVAGLIEPRLAPAERIALLERLAAARSEAASAQAAVAAAKAAYERARTLNADNRNVSDRALQEAEARSKGEEARAAGAAETVRLLEGSVGGPAATPLRVARGGQVVEVMAQPGEAVESGQPLLRVVHFERLLARVEAPAGEPVLPGVATARIAVLGYEERPLVAERVALGAAVDPGTQGQTFLFRIDVGGLPLRPGLAVTAYLRAPGARRRGVVVPRSAVVHAEGRFWVYVHATEGALVRRAVTLERSLGRGWFVPAGIAAGHRVVTEGAQALLSEEFKSQIGGEEDEAH